MPKLIIVELDDDKAEDLCALAGWTHEQLETAISTEAGRWLDTLLQHCFDACVRAEMPIGDSLTYMGRMPGEDD